MKALLMTMIMGWSAMAFAKGASKSLGVPSDLVAIPAGANIIALFWTDNSANELGFVVQRSTDGNRYYEIADLAGTNNSTSMAFDDVTALGNKTYYYRVCAYDSTGRTDYSESASATTPGAKYSVAGRVVDGVNSNPIANAQILANTDSVTGVNPDASIPDRSPGGIVAEIDITDTSPISNLKVAIQITHSYVGDLRITLVHPDGTTVVLRDQTGSSTGNLNTSYPDQSSPVESLNVLNGKSVNGQWKVIVEDLAASDIGTLDMVSISNRSTAIVAKTDASGDYSIPALRSGDYTFSVQAAGFEFANNPRAVFVYQNLSDVNFIGSPR